MVLVLPTLFYVAVLAIATPFTPTNAGGSTYVFTITGPWGEPTCQESNSQVLGLEEILAVFEDEATCDDGISSTHAFTIGQIAITETGLAAFVDGGAMHLTVKLPMHLAGMTTWQPLILIQMSIDAFALTGRSMQAGLVQCSPR